MSLQNWVNLRYGAKNPEIQRGIIILQHATQIETCSMNLTCMASKYLHKAHSVTSKHLCNVFKYDKFEFVLNRVNVRMNTFASIFPVTQSRAAYYPDLQVQASCMNSAYEHHVDVCHPEPVCFNHPRTAPQRCKSTPHISPRGPCRPAGITPRAARPGWCHWPPQSHGRRRPYRRDATTAATSTS